MTYINDALKPLVAERERHARMVDQLDRAINAVEKLGREGKLTIVPDQPAETVIKCNIRGCAETLTSVSQLEAHLDLYHADKARARRKQRDVEDAARAAENAKKRADEADERILVTYPPMPGLPDGYSMYIPPEFDPPPVTAGPPAHNGMVPTGLPKRPLDHDKIRAAAWTDPEDEVKNV